MAIWSRSKVFQLSKGYYGRSKNCFRISIRRVFKALQYQYRARRIRRREIRTTWIRSINAGVRDMDISYSRFIYGLNRSNILLDRKILSNLAQYEPYSFRAVVNEVTTQVKLPPSRNPEKMTYNEAIEKRLLFFGPYDNRPLRDEPFRFIKPAPGQADWYG